MNTSNRPTIKVTEYELQWKASKKMYWKELNAENTDWSDNQNIPTGNTRIIERPMNNTEYIEHLEIKLQVLKELSLNDKESTSYFKIEGGGVVYTQRYVETQWKENQELKDQLRDRDFSDKNYQAYLKLETEYQCLLANNNELKVTLMNTALKDISRIAEIENQFLKVVESVFKEHIIFGTYRDDYGNSIIMCNCDSEFRRKDYMEHLLQEIKSVIEKGKE